MERLKIDLDNKSKHILQQKLLDMKRRCYNPECKYYKDYGGRGISICQEWIDKKNGHSNFQKWALENGWKKGLSIDRIDNNGNYEPSNCRWATPEQQCNNTRRNHYLTIHGETKTISQWANIIGVCPNTLVSRIKYGWSEDDLLKPKTKQLKMSKAEMAKEIKMWRNLEEKGSLLRLPCKVGDTVYQFVDMDICNGDDDTPCPAHIDKDYPCVKCKHFGGKVEEFKNISLIDIVKSMDDFGKTVFLTREEAEKAFLMTK